jgi:HlyD family type I secretion membrane fusion protein
MAEQMAENGPPMKTNFLEAWRKRARSLFQVVEDGPTADKNDSAEAVASWKRPALIGYGVIILTFGVMGSWSAFARLDRAVVAMGTVNIESSRKTVQHLEGGIVNDIRIKEGQLVKEGDLLLRLASLQAKANSDLVRNQLEAGLVLEARLSAELNKRPEVTLPPEIEERMKTSAELRKVVDDQRVQFQERQASLAGQVALYEAKITQLTTEMEGIAVEKASTEKQVGYINEELVGLRELREKNLIPISRALAMERERTRLEGVVGRAVADTAKSQNGISEAKLQISQLRQKFQEEASGQLLETRQKINDLREKASVANDILSRQDILSPKTGTVQNLKVFTIGQVIRPGEPMMEIVPTDEKLVIHAQLPTVEIEHIRQGMTAEIRFPAFHSRRIPVILGTLDNVSRDRLVDEASKQPYFLGIVSLDKIAVPEEYRGKIIAGMPAEIVIPTGERTAFSYMISPLTDNMRRGFRE